MRVRGCQGCRACKQKGIDCVVKDDLTPYWEDLHTCDALLVSSPNYASTVTGPMITYMNRHYCLLDENWQPRIKPGIKLIGVFAQGAQGCSRCTRKTMSGSYTILKIAVWCCNTCSCTPAEALLRKTNEKELSRPVIRYKKRVLSK